MLPGAAKTTDPVSPDTPNAIQEMMELDQPRRWKRCDVSEEEFERRHALVQDEKFWSWYQGTDHVTYFKSKENLNFWSE